MSTVPAAPGVPPLLTGTSPALSGLDVLTSDSLVGLGESLDPTWGIFKNGKMVITADTVVAFDYKQEWVIADFPIETGGFVSYDKVALPYDARVRFIAGENANNRGKMLASIAAIAGTLNLYDVVSPEAVYLNACIRHYDYRRTTVNGLGIIQVDIWLWWVRIGPGSSGGLALATAPSGTGGSATTGAGTTASGGGSSSGASAAPSGALVVNNGLVQTQTLNSAQQSLGSRFT